MQRSNVFLLRVLVMAVTACVQVPAQEIVISAPNLVSTPGSSGEFDVLLTVASNIPFQTGAFSLDILSSNPLLQFTDASTMTTIPYVFAGNSFDQINGFPLATKTGQELVASDAANNGLAFVRNNETVSMGEVFYTISRSAPLDSTFAVTFAAGTSIANSMGNSFAINTVNGTVSTAVIPEPVQIPLIIASFGLIALSRMRSRSI